MGPDSVSVAYISHYKPVLNRPFATELRWGVTSPGFGHPFHGRHSSRSTERGGVERIFEF